MPKFNYPTISSFLVAFCIYAVILAGLFINLSIFTDPPKKYTDDKDAFMDIIVVEREISETKKAPKQADEIKKDEPKPEPIKEPEPVKEPEITTPKESLPPPPEILPEPIKEPEPVKEPEPKPEPKPSLKSLFSDIDTSKLKDTPKKQANKKSEKSEAKQSTQATDIVKSLKIDTTTTTPKSQKTGTYDPVIGAIEKQIQRRWQGYKANSDNFAKITFMVDMSGNFSYEITELSYDDEFNEKVKDCLEKLSKENFPFSKTKSLTINLTLRDKLDTQ
ncbi:TonB C-terminal domain-containing protein [Campylobacter gastrosuis]|uniref:TonB C-terminal domain-containing protein n=1 Tax=Campylobacter gastrosuis TaxID=2974576 RepID=A0ABT7HR56_9BACT|nr:TonB C-terminal domain-containing protein [Campylobacter gastrosuis]MDL0088898.1 TonB C-terminal domain-containing protein [Campylobacter gastrosuis]